MADLAPAKKIDPTYLTSWANYTTTVIKIMTNEKSAYPNSLSKNAYQE